MRPRRCEASPARPRRRLDSRNSKEMGFGHDGRPSQGVESKAVYGPPSRQTFQSLPGRLPEEPRGNRRHQSKRRIKDCADANRHSFQSEQDNAQADNRAGDRIKKRLNDADVADGVAGFICQGDVGGVHADAGEHERDRRSDEGSGREGITHRSRLAPLRIV